MTNIAIVQPVIIQKLRLFSLVSRTNVSSIVPIVGRKTCVKCLNANKATILAVNTPPPGKKPTLDWREKEAERQRIQEESRQRTARAKLQYDKERSAKRGAIDIPAELQTPLCELPETPYVDEDGCISDLSKDGAKASVYAVLGEDHKVEYVGVSRSINPTLRLHMARVPSKCYGVKVCHIDRPSRAVLEAVRQAWVDESGEVPGNDGGEMQNKWENPLDCKPLMTDEDRAHVDEQPEGPLKKKALKVIARRFEAEILEVIQARGLTEQFRFDPKLKDQGFLDLKNLAPKKPDTTIPSK
mmetsp:Transcript_13304/g.18174  ORF Transcript_13304/g.18174 Transcript_13304/m.18174 type:complete len:299 (+) Transcript_13304:47-943(+)|eukprot:CAMPEP_0196580428 /NCGR_PEP_ID=MMETSP1081-20130531/28622_1 /TAXON_ID=36882 /ORGANISM="Pyramimonas amylifera, Strain CCMP720" /LENGTH=298 /DNA_ID=CAMNT_0041900289 /DNA_START=47 /DNA_END=943 /DNA_ORIENTATION=-